MFAFLPLFCAAAQAGSTFEIAPGTDLGPVFDALAPGDTLILDDGLYEVPSTLGVGAVLSPDDEPITIRARNRGGAVLEGVLGEDGDGPSAILRVEGAQNVVLDGLVLRLGQPVLDIGSSASGLVLSEVVGVEARHLTIGPVGGNGLVVTGMSSDVQVERTEIREAAQGSGLVAGCYDASCWTTGLVLANLWVHDLPAEGAQGLVLHHGTQGALVTDSVVYATNGRGVFLGSTERGDPNVFEGNAVWSVVDEGILAEGAARLRNNVVFNVDGEGIRLNDPDRSDYRDLILSSNTVVDTRDYALRVQDATGLDTLTLANNVFCNPLGLGVLIDRADGDTGVAAPGKVWANAVCGYSEGVSAVLGEVFAGGGYTDFMDAVAWDFYPANGSTLVDAGDPTGESWIPTTDFNGAPREGDAPDVGAYEWDGEGNPGWAIREGFKELGTDRAADPATVGGCCQDDPAAAEKALVVLLPVLGVGAVRRRRR